MPGTLFLRAWFQHAARALAAGCLLAALGWSPLVAEEPAAGFLVGVAETDLTPTAPVPMWGYAARHALLSQGTMDPLQAKAVVISAGGKKLALVGTDLGRGPTQAMMVEIRRMLAEKLGIEHVIISGSHSHHGPVIELTDRPGFGQGSFQAAADYAGSLPGKLVEVITAANAALVPARLGVASREVSLNRNRHTKREPKTTDPALVVMRIDDASGKPLVVLVNFAAHPTMIDEMDLRFSADYPGHMKRKVEAALAAKCVFMQGASGDMSANPPAGVSGPQAFGEALADQVLEIAGSITTQVPSKPSLKGQTDRFVFGSRVDFGNPLIGAAFSRAFFPELVRNFVEEYRDGIVAEMNTLVLNGEIAMVSGSGEFFSKHAVRLRERCYLPHTLFFGYANGHNLYFPTIEAASEGGYGADAQMSPVELGAGERMLNQALLNIYALQGKVKAQPARLPKPAPATAAQADTAEPSAGN